MPPKPRQSVLNHCWVGPASLHDVRLPPTQLRAIAKRARALSIALGPASSSLGSCALANAVRERANDVCGTFRH